MPIRIPGWRAVGVVALALALLAAAAGCTSDKGGDSAAAPAAQTAANSSGQPSDPFEHIPDVVRKMQTSVVTIVTSKGLGSGVVWSSDGVIVTNDHVVSGSKQVEVAFADGRRVGGTVGATDAVTDLAVVRAKRSGLPAANFQRKLPAVGDLAIAMGSPLGFENTVTAGIISGLHRQIPGSAQETQSLVDLMQTDAAISPGNSGGALVNASGQVTGISEAFIPPSQGAVSIGFAIPAGTVVDVVGQLLKTGHASHAFLGIQPGDLTPEIASELGVSATGGVVVLSLVGGGPAAKAGMQPGDVITAVDGHPVSDVEDFLAVLRDDHPGQTVTVSFLRGKARMDAKVVLANRPAP
jgi:serine protease DegQ